MQTLKIFLVALICLVGGGRARAVDGDAGRTQQLGQRVGQRVAVVAVGTTQLGVREVGRNGGPAVERYIKFVGSPAGSAWCSCFVSWVLRQAGVMTARFGRARDWFDARHILKRGQVPQPGDLVGYRWGLDHIGHVGIIEKWGTSVTCVTIEGNTGGGGAQTREGEGVYRNWRDKRQVSAVANVIDNPKY